MNIYPIFLPTILERLKPAYKEGSFSEIIYESELGGYGIDGFTKMLITKTTSIEPFLFGGDIEVCYIFDNYSYSIIFNLEKFYNVFKVICTTMSTSSGEERFKIPINKLVNGDEIIKNPHIYSIWNSLFSLDRRDENLNNFIAFRNL